MKRPPPFFRLYSAFAASTAVDGDGEIISTEARLILQKYTGKIEQFPVED